MFDSCLESVCRRVRVPAHLSSSRSLFPSACFIPLFSHTIFFATPQTQGFLVRPEQGLIYCTVELWEGRASQHKVANGSQPPCWWWCCFMSPADGDGLSWGKSFDVRGSDMHCRPRGDQNTGRPSRKKSQIKREEHLSAVQPCGPSCGWLSGPSDLALLMCWASALALPLTIWGNTILKSFIISSFPLLNNTWR